ncbi:MAG: response regulator [Lachnospiraceae bacterium]|nr:response regulator [Lachnospiraceae bacterium]
MIKLLIVEDEVSSRDGLRTLLTSSLPLQIETASDGYEGYEKALYFSPDIIISDIKMPKWNGITMIDHLRKKGVSCQVIFLTGFAEFDYAQKAIQLGTADYILKPIIPQNLIKKISNLIQTLERQNLQQSYLNGNSKLHLLSEDDVQNFSHQLFNYNYTDYFLAVVYLEDKRHLPQEIKDFLSRTENAHVVSLPDRHYRGIILGFSNHMIYHSLISQLSLLLQKYKYITCIYTLKKASQNIAWFSDFNQLMNSICWSIVYNSSFFAFDKLMLQECTTTTDLPFYKKELQRLYYIRDYAACLKLIQNNITKMQQKQFHPQQILTVVTSSILNVFSEQQYLQALNKITRAITMHEITSCLNWYFEIGTSQETDTHYSHLIQSAVCFIKEHYNEPISLSMIAEKLSITPQYLSKLFMQETAKTFVDFLTQIRMEKAKYLLINSNLQINLICTQVGYTDPKYFCTSFKKYTGLTPNQYRKSNI